jgi:hypothetical protein
MQMQLLIYTEKPLIALADRSIVCFAKEPSPCLITSQRLGMGVGSRAANSAVPS